MPNFKRKKNGEFVITLNYDEYVELRELWGNTPALQYIDKEKFSALKPDTVKFLFAIEDIFDKFFWEDLAK